MGQFMAVPLIDRDLTGQTLIVTGANTGLGMEATKHFARMNPQKIIMAVRNVKKGNEAKDKIQAETKFNDIEVRELDLSSFNSVIAFADSIQKTEKRLDVLISNAGVSNSVRNMTKDGWEESIQVNHLSNLLLLILLVPLLRKSAQEFNIEPRIIVVASAVHAWTQFTEEGKAPEILKFMNEQKDMSNRYPTSKLLNVLMTRKFASVFPDITIHCLDPGFCKTELSRDSSFFKNLLFQTFRNMFARTAEQGSRTLVHAAIYEGWLSKNIPNARYFSSCIEQAPTIQARNKDFQDRLWVESEKILLEVEPNIVSIIRNKNNS